MLTIIRMTLREVLNKQIVLIAAILGVVFLALYGTVLHYSSKDVVSDPMGKMMAVTLFPNLFSMGLYFGSFLVNLFAIFISVASISSEIENGIIHSIIAKPIRRMEIILGKYLGYAVAVDIFASCIFALLVAVTWYLSGFTPSNIGSGAGLFLLQPLILLTLTIFGSTIMLTMANGITVIMLYIIGTVGGMVEMVGGLIKNQSLTTAGIVTSLLIPNDAIYRKMVSELLLDSSTALNPLTMSPFGAVNPASTVMIIYTFVYIFAFLFFAVYLFTKRDI